MKWWQHSVGLAEEIGQSSGENTNLKCAMGVLIELGVVWDLARAKKAIDRYKPHMNYYVRFTYVVVAFSLIHKASLYHTVKTGFFSNFSSS
jgi:hypothetical protein